VGVNRSKRTAGLGDRRPRFTSKRRTKHGNTIASNGHSRNIATCRQTRASGVPPVAEGAAHDGGRK